MKKKNVSKAVHPKKGKRGIKHKKKSQNDHQQSEQKKFVQNGLKSKTGNLRERLINQLKGSRLRYVNEQISVSSSDDAMKYFQVHRDEFLAYHNDYEHQASLWPKNPTDRIIKEVQQRVLNGKGLSIADFGCGYAKLAQTLRDTNTKVFSFDFVALNEFVTPCDMKNTKLFSNSIDIAVFCLSLMGVDLNSKIQEANRVLKNEGIMKIAEVKSRFRHVDSFVKDIEAYGFVLMNKDLSDEAFYYFNFRKIKGISKNKKHKLPDIKLKSCLYKQR